MGAFGSPIELEGPPGASEQSSHITGVAISFSDPKEVAVQLQTQYGVSVTAKDRHGVRGLRVACHIYNTTEDIDTFVSALTRLGDQIAEGTQQPPQLTPSGTQKL